MLVLLAAILWLLVFIIFRNAFLLATSIRLSPETEERLRFLATQTGRSKAFYLRELIEGGIDDLEDYYLAADVLERVRKGREGLHSAADVKADLALDG